MRNFLLSIIFFASLLPFSFKCNAYCDLPDDARCISILYEEYKFYSSPEGNFFYGELAEALKRLGVKVVVFNRDIDNVDGGYYLLVKMDGVFGNSGTSYLKSNGAWVYVYPRVELHFKCSDRTYDFKDKIIKLGNIELYHHVGNLQNYFIKALTY